MSRPAPHPAGSAGATAAAAPHASAALPPYARVKQVLKHELVDGAWPPGSLMPSEAELVQRFAVSRMTVNRALRELQAEGLVERTQGVGTFAAPLHRVAATLTLRDVHDEIESRGHRHSAQVHALEALRAPAALAEQLGLATGAQVFRSLIVHHENGVALQCEDRYVNPACVSDYLEHDFTRVTPTHLLFERTALARAQFTVQAAPPTPKEARLLGIEAGTPCLVMLRRTFTRDAVITLARLVHPGTRYELQGEYRP
jgi:GntR family transcriptional regulator, histidine utilization repressor